MKSLWNNIRFCAFTFILRFASCVMPLDMPESDIVAKYFCPMIEELMSMEKTR